MKNIRETTHFSIVELADGVYAALHNGRGAAFSNAGVIDLGGKTVVFDTTKSPAAGTELARQALELTGNPASIVIISHHHDDHWMGNQAFSAKTRIYSTQPALDAMLPEAEELKDRKDQLLITARRSRKMKPRPGWRKIQSASNYWRAPSGATGTRSRIWPSSSPAFRNG